MKFPIPNQSDQTEYLFVLTCPHDWLGVVNGAIWNLTRGRYWDERTGNIKQAQQQAIEIWESVSHMPLQDIVDAIESLQTSDDIVNKLEEIRAEIAALTLATTNGSDTNDVNLQQIVDAINGIELSGSLTLDVNSLVVALGDIHTAISEQTTQQTADSQNVADYINSVYLALTARNGGEGANYLMDTLDALATSVEQARLYEGIKLDFYGQTMTSQNEQLRAIVSAIASKSEEIVVFARPFMEGYDSSSELPDQVISEYDLKLNAYTVHQLVKKAFLAFDGSLPLGPYISSQQDFIYSIFSEISAFHLVNAWGEAIAMALAAWEALKGNNYSWTWSQLADEWEGLAPNWICWALQNAPNQTEATGSELYQFGQDQAVSLALQDGLLLVGGSNAIVYVFNEYLGGDGSTLWQNFYALREQLKDGFDPSAYPCE